MLYKIDLSGEWGFRPDEEKKGLLSQYYLLGGTDKITLPSTVSLSKLGRPNPKSETGFLTDAYAYEGYGWYYKTADLSGIPCTYSVKLFLERTRYTTLWINGEKIGSRNSLCTPHLYDISRFAGEIISIAVCVSNCDYATKGGHMTSPDTQSNWNGITGEICILVSENPCISSIDAYPDADKKSVKFRLELEGAEKADIELWGASSDGKIIDKQRFHICKSSSEITLSLGENASLWSEYTPVTYTVRAAICGSADVASVTFGLRSFTANGLNLLCNGRKIFLRGKHDGMIFPLTGAAPTSVEEWIKIFETAQKWGINHYRFHTCCPPDAAFTAADIIGIYMQPELPFWGTITDKSDDNHNAAEQEYLITEGRRILKTFGNHPSFVMMSLGNELWGSKERLNEILGMYKSIDSRRLYTQGSNNFQFWPNIQPNDDFFSGVRLSKSRLIRGSYADCDAPLGFVQTDEPNTSHSYDELIFPKDLVSEASAVHKEIEIQYGTGVKKITADGSDDELFPTKPIITHEVGQYCSFPDFDEIPMYSGPLKPRNLETFRRRIAERKLLPYAEDFHISSGRLAFQCYKYEIEAAMRSKYISGFQLLDLQDFTGQGTALVGMLNAFMKPKKFADEKLRELWLGFCSDTVILAEIDSFIVSVGDVLNIPVLLRYMRPEKLSNCKICWSFDKQSGELDIPDSSEGIVRIGVITPQVRKTGTLKLSLNLGDVNNVYYFHAYQKADGDFPILGKSIFGNSCVYTVNSLEEAEKLLSAGEKVLYIPQNLPESVRGFYCTDFWCYPMFRSISESMCRQIPVGTLGLCIDCQNYPLDFETADCSSPQWYHIVSHADCAILDGTDADFRPIIMMTDNFERCHKLGILYEAAVGDGRLMVCTSRLYEISQRPEVREFYRSLLRYMHSERFAPTHQLTLEQLGLKATPHN